MEYTIPDEQLLNVINIPDTFQGFDKNQFSIAPREQELIDCVLISNGQVLDRCDKLAEQIFDDYRGKVLDIFVILNGAFQFFSDLLNSINKVRAARKPRTEDEDVIVRFNFHRVSSYHNTESTGDVSTSFINLSNNILTCFYE